MNNITVNELNIFLLEKENFRLIDVREKWELDIAKIEKSIDPNSPFAVLEKLL